MAERPPALPSFSFGGVKLDGQGAEAMSLYEMDLEFGAWFLDFILEVFQRDIFLIQFHQGITEAQALKHEEMAQGVSYNVIIASAGMFS